MAWKKLTFVLIPHSQSGVRQISIHRNVLVAIGIMLICAIVIMLFYIIGFEGKQYYLAQTRDLEAKNALLEGDMTIFDSTLVNIEHKVAVLESTNTAIIREAEISDLDLRLYGDTADGPATEAAALLPAHVTYLVDRLDRRSAVFEKNAAQLFTVCTENEDFVRRVPSIRPASGYISREFGRSFDIYSKTEKVYQGVDIQNVLGTPVVATANGVVEAVATSDELGRYIVIDHGNGYKTRYSHIQTVIEMEPKVYIAQGDPVVRGQQIGSIGRTGISINPVSAHLMYSVFHNGLPVNPRDYFFAPEFAAAPPETEAAPRG